MLQSSQGLLGLLSGAGPVVLLVLALLLVFSLLSWTIIIYKGGMLRKALGESRDFLDYFFEVPNPEKVFTESEEYAGGSLARVYRAGYMELVALKGNGVPERRIAEERISRAVKRTMSDEVKRLGRFIPFLATVGNTAPFIGLFGTVWGIMGSFHDIGLQQSASLATVAPGIAEALVATAAGLVAAIPSVMGYNYFSSQLEEVERDMDDFSGEYVITLVNELK